MFKEIISSPIIFFSGFLAGISIILLKHPDNFRKLMYIFSLAFFIRATLSICFYIISHDGFLFKNDGWAYHGNGWEILQMQQHGINVTNKTFSGHSSSGVLSNFDFLISFIYSITGKSPLSLFLINATAGSLTVIFIYFMANDIFGKKVAVISSFLCAIWPSLVMWSTQSMKEPIVDLAACALIWSLISLRYRFGISYLIVGISAYFILAKLRFYIIPIFFLVSSIWWLITSRYMVNYKAIIISLLSALLLFCLIAYTQTLNILNIIRHFFIKQFETNLDKESILSLINFARGTRAFGNTAIFPGYNFNSIISVIAYLPLGLIFVWFSPFPWQLGSINQIVAFPEMILFYLLLPYTINGLIFAVKYRFKKSYLLVFFIGTISIVLGIVEGNIGTIFRHRSMVLYIIFIFTAVGIIYLQNKGRKLGLNLSALLRFAAE